MKENQKEFSKFTNDDKNYKQNRYRPVFQSLAVITKVKKMKKHSILLFCIIGLISCDCKEPNKEYIANCLFDLHPSHNIISMKNIENSPPCFYWEIKYEADSNFDNISNEGWRFCESNPNCWRLEISNNDSIYCVNISDSIK